MSFFFIFYYDRLCFPNFVYSSTLGWSSFVIVLLLVPTLLIMVTIMVSHAHQFLKLALVSLYGLMAHSLLVVCSCKCFVAEVYNRRKVE